VCGDECEPEQQQVNPTERRLELSNDETDQGK
jgi:hypothetical protein